MVDTNIQFSRIVSFCSFFFSRELEVSSDSTESHMIRTECTRARQNYGEMLSEETSEPVTPAAAEKPSGMDKIRQVEMGIVAGS